MLKDSDLQAFVNIVCRAEVEPTVSPEICPDTVLRAAKPTGDLLHRNEYDRLRRSLKIAAAVGDVPDSAHRLLHAIVEDLAAKGFCYLPLTHSREWLDATGWDLSNLQSLPSDYLPHAVQDRQFVVGTACKALRDRGYRVDITAHGPRIDADTRTQIAQQVHSLFAQTGIIGAAELNLQRAGSERDSGRVAAADARQPGHQLSGAALPDAEELLDGLAGEVARVHAAEHLQNFWKSVKSCGFGRYRADSHYTPRQGAIRHYMIFR